jgi:hypothetical protein
MNKNQQDQIARLAADVAELRQRTARIPSTFPTQSTSVYVASILGFNTLSSGQPGIKKTSTTLSTVVDFDEMTVATTVDYVGVGYLWIDDVQQFVTVAGVLTPKRVKIALDSRSPIGHALCDQDWVKLDRAQITIGTNVRAYRPVFYTAS